MRLIGKCLAALLIAPAVACHDTSGPPPLPANYMLVSVNGRPLPAIISPIPEAPTVLDGTLFLDGSGNAIIHEHQKVMIAPGDVTYNTTYTDNTIQFHIDCPIGAFCIQPPVGTFVNGHLLVTMGANNALYDYQLVMPD
jgi:hypothetical protein